VAVLQKQSGARLTFPVEPWSASLGEIVSSTPAWNPSELAMNAARSTNSDRAT
jgi:hypothetical protein